MPETMPRPGSSPETLQDRLQALGLTPPQLSPEVRQAMGSLLMQLDQTTERLQRNQKRLDELEKMVETDFLLPIGNRRALYHRLEWAISMTKRYDQPCTLLYFDLNDFKQINDSYGHLAGDAALEHVVSVISDNIRDSDFLARISGDEFALLMFHTQEDMALRRGQAIAATLETQPLQWEGKALTLSTAIGSTLIEAEDTAETALHRADQAMYANKRQSKSLERAS